MKKSLIALALMICAPALAQETTLGEEKVFLIQNGHKAAVGNVLRNLKEGGYFIICESPFSAEMEAQLETSQTGKAWTSFHKFDVKRDPFNFGTKVKITSTVPFYRLNVTRYAGDLFSCWIEKE
jgi:hypothetical protein